MSDYGHDRTDEQISALERRLQREYEAARKEAARMADEYFAAFAQRDAAQKALLDAGELTQQQYTQWRLAQMGRGERFCALRDKLAERLLHADEAAAAYINDVTPGVYAANRNYAAYTVEQAVGATDFTLWDEQTVKRLLRDEPDLMPYYPEEKAVNRGIDLAWGKRQISAQVTQSILLGDNLKQMADKLQQSVTSMSRTSAIRAARTAVTGAECAGRMDSFAAAQKKGIRLKKQWMATLDGRTRHSHAMLDGVSVANDALFDNGCRFPGDPNGPPGEIYNCRCTLVADLDGVRELDGEKHVTYREWEKQKKQSGGYSGAKKTEGWEDRHAEQYYEEVRNRKPFVDAKKIAQHVDFTERQIEDIRNHVFIFEQPRDGTRKRFDPDFDQSQAWQRLVDGNGIRRSDIVFLQHEYYELTIMREQGYTYEKAHELTNQVFNWQDILDEEG